jgi:hypothetical protein
MLITVSLGLLLTLAFVLGPWGRKGQPALLRILPWLVIPLLGLMTAGIIRRVSDYGWTVERVYLALFNLWCYGACLYLGLNGGRKYRWIPISFAAILLLASIGPWNTSRMIRKGMVKDVRALLADTELPLTPDGLYGLGPEDGEAVLDKLEYLKYNYDSTVVKEFVKLPFDRYNYKVDHPYMNIRLYAKKDDISMDVPEGYTHCAYFSFHMADVISVSEERFRFSLTEGDEIFQFDLPLSKPEAPVTLTEVDSRAVFHLTEISVDAEVLDAVAHNTQHTKKRDGSVSGLLFY